jgi:hypothetical protein
MISDTDKRAIDLCWLFKRMMKEFDMTFEQAMEIVLLAEKQVATDAKQTEEQVTQ